MATDSGSAAQRFVGVWRLVGETADGEPVAARGPNPQGVIVYTAGGHSLSWELGDLRPGEERALLWTGVARGTGEQVWNDLREQDDPETPVSAPGKVSWSTPPLAPAAGQVVHDFQPWAQPLGVRRSAAMSNALLVSARRSATGHPIMVAGPQVGYTYPEILMELDLHGGGLDARGAAFPGLSFYVLLGRGKDFAWSATSAETDVVDDFAETLCGDDTHYVFKGECREMGTFDAGTLHGVLGEPDRRLV